MQATNPIWAEVQQSLQKTLSKPSFETWIRPAKFNCFENGLLTLIAPNTFSSDWLRKNYCETIEKAAKEICGHDVKVVFKSETNASSDLTSKGNLDEVLDKALLIIMAKWHGFGRCKTRLSKDIGKSNSAKIQKVMTNHTISVAKYLKRINIIDITIAISNLGRKNCKFIVIL